MTKIIVILMAIAAVGCAGVQNAPMKPQMIIPNCLDFDMMEYPEEELTQMIRDGECIFNPTTVAVVTI
jgi:hypothetical protein